MDLSNYTSVNYRQMEDKKNNQNVESEQHKDYLKLAKILNEDIELCNYVSLQLYKLNLKGHSKYWHRNARYYQKKLRKLQKELICVHNIDLAKPHKHGIYLEKLEMNATNKEEFKLCFSTYLSEMLKNEVEHKEELDNLHSSLSKYSKCKKYTIKFLREQYKTCMFTDFDVPTILEQDKCLYKLLKEMKEI